MTAAELLSDLRALRARGVELRAEGPRLHFRAPRGALAERDRAELAGHRDALLALLRWEHATGIILDNFPGARQLCAGCREPMPSHPGGICFACDLGLDRSDFPTRLLPHALALRAELGPAGGQGLRVGAIRARARATRRATVPRAEGFDPGPARRFLEILFAGVPGFVEVRTLLEESAEQTFAASIAEALDACTDAARRGRNVYIGVATRRDRSSGKKHNLCASRVVWTDRDYHAESDREAYERALQAFPFQPSLRVASGGGEHTYWRLAEPFALDTPECIARFEHVLKGLADALQADPLATDASRILRVPATMNLPDARKRARGRTPARVELLHTSERVYRFDDFAELEERGRALAGQAPATVEYESGAWDGELPERLRFLLGDSRVRARFERGASGLSDTSTSGVDYALASLLAHRGLDGAEIEAAVRASRRRAGLHEKSSSYYATTVGKALADARVRGTL